MNDYNLVLGDDHPIFSEEPTTEVEPVVEPVIKEATTSQEAESQYLITLDRRNLQQQLLDLVNQDPDAKQIYNRSVGNQAARRYQPRIAELEAERDAWKQLHKQSEYSKLTQEEVNQRFTTDPEFAAEYARVIHSNVSEPNTEAVNEIAKQQLVNGVEFILQSGVSQGLTREDVTAIWGNIQQGAYDKDETGTDFPPSQWREVLANLQNDVTSRLVNKRTVTVPTEAPPIEPPVVTATRGDTASPDMSPSGARGVRTNSMTMTEFKALPWEKQFEFIGDSSVEQAVTDGKITIES